MTPQTMKKKLTLPKLGTVSDYRHLWMLSFWILYLILYVVVEHAVTTDYWVSYLPLDDKIPFCEYFIVPYCMWHPLLFLMTVYLAFYDVETFRKYMWFILAGLVSACCESPGLRRRHLQWVMIPLGVLICISTVFVKQHSILDMFVAIPYSAVAWLVSFQPWKRKKA